ncbi:MAG: GNAT family N-acetyltransferase [Spirochaetales bacterium]|nr:GNAT family N-acetyltransferase [Spirochaetales bacterium]
MNKKAAGNITIKWIYSIAKIPKQMWNELALPLTTPFLEWEWLYLLEESGSTCPQTGWMPAHLTLWREDRLIAAAAFYIKSHSEGEFVFDYIWAQAARQLGINYYPKLVGMSPATPVPGYRFLIAQNENEKELTRLMLQHIDRFCADQNLSGVHFLYTDLDWCKRILHYGYMSWLHQVYEWRNREFTDFSDYLMSFNKNQRHNIRRERKKLSRQGITIKPIAGKQAQRLVFERMHDFYAHTNYKYGPWGCKYLTRDFFLGLHEIYNERVVFMAAYPEYDRSEPLALAMFFRKNSSLYGRYWGSTEMIDSLHFNTCYYAPIEWSIGQGISRFDPGVGSDHKARRGFEAFGNYSLHRFFNSTLTLLMRSNMKRINLLEQENIDNLNSMLPVNSTGFG